MQLLRIHHLGIAARGLDGVMVRMARLFDLAADHTEDVAEQKVKTGLFPTETGGVLLAFSQGLGSGR